MNLLGLDGKKHSIITKDYIVLNNDAKAKSAGHKRARILIRELFPCSIILEEVPVYGYKGALYCDFLLPTEKLLIEVHGVQHYQYIQHFHKSLQGFAMAKKRDSLKQEWAELNNYRYIELPDGDDNEEWTKRLR
jgi:hypothetical protein